MRPRPVAGVVVVLWALLGPTASEAASVEIGPEAALCAEINGLGPGDELVLLRVRPRRGQVRVTPAKRRDGLRPRQAAGR